MPTISSASVRLATTATDTVAPSTISTPLLLLLPVGRHRHHGRTLGGPSHPWKPRPEPVGGPAPRAPASVAADSGSATWWADDVGGDQPGGEQPDQRDGEGQRERWGGDRGQHDQQGGHREAGDGSLAAVAVDPAVQQPEDDQEQRDRHG